MAKTNKQSEMARKLKFVPRWMALRPAVAFWLGWMALLMLLTPVVFSRDMFGAQLFADYKIKNVISGKSSHEAATFYILSLLGIGAAAFYGNRSRRGMTTVVDDMDAILARCHFAKGIGASAFLDVYRSEMADIMARENRLQRHVMRHVIAGDARHFDYMVDAIDIAKGDAPRLDIGRHDFNVNIIKFVTDARVKSHPQDIERLIGRIPPHYMPTSVAKKMNKSR